MTPEGDGSFWSLFEETPSPEASSSPIWDLFTEPAPAREARTVHPQETPCALNFNENQVFWAMRNLPVEEAVKHFFVCGTPGSGKTIIIDLFLQSIAPRFRPDWPHPEQLILFDAKGEVIPFLAGLGLRPEDENVWIMHPGDERGAVWNIAEAARTPLMARHIAALLVPEERHSNAPYFTNAARELVFAAITALTSVAGERWTFRDLLCALDSEDHIARVGARHAPAKRVVNRYLGDKQHFGGILSSLATKLGRFEQVAALWHTSTSGRVFSIPEFLKRPGVLILSNDPQLRESFWPINALLLRALTQAILRGPETRQPRHWFVLDEFRDMEQVSCIQDLLNRGRSKGASVMLGFQSLEGLIEVHGTQGANEILGQCASKTFLRVGGPTTAEWAAKFFGQIRETEAVLSESWNREGYSHSYQYSVRDRPLFLESLFMDLPFPKPGLPFYSISDVPCLHTTLLTRRWFDQVLAWRCQPGDVPPVLHRQDAHDQTLWPWSAEEEQYFCERPPAPPSPSTSPSSGTKSKKKSPRRKGKAPLPNPTPKRHLP